MILGLILTTWWYVAPCYETDPYSFRDQNISDSREVLNREVNRALDDIARNWSGKRDHYRVAAAVYWKLGGIYWVDKLERWAMNSPEVEKLPTTRYRSIYRGMPFWVTRAAFVFGVGDSIKINGTLIGTDKIGHFFSQGRKFFKRYLRYGSETRAAKRSAATERGIFGRATTGSYSNADLVANYEGYRFYRSLLEDDIVPGKQAILRWEGDRLVMQRAFDWADHVNAFWDEALNPNAYDRPLKWRMRARLKAMCEDQDKDICSLFDNPDYRVLFAKYQHIGLVDTSDMLVPNICGHSEQHHLESTAGRISSN
ncbi:MAG: hypothetical protein KDC35_01730 [Acidobacteria bacterium]|nr:hypothetical protein [Acidobacteriota bacterium]